MTLNIKSPREAAHRQGVKALVHGPAGAGKTVLCTTAGEPTLIISAEGGLLSIQDAPEHVHVVEVSTIDQVREAYSYLAGEKHQYRWVALDSISEIAEVVLAAEKRHTKDMRKAYGTLIDMMGEMIRAFRDLPMNVIMTSKQERVESEDGVLFCPSMPGSKLAQGMSYWFDLVLALRVDRDAEGNPIRWLQTFRSSTHEAKDRSGRLDAYEPPSLEHLSAKIRGTNPQLKEVKNG